jgi:hypothetical protein
VIRTFGIHILFVSLKSGICVIITSYYATDSCRCWLVCFLFTFALLVLKNVLMLLVDDDAPFTIFSVSDKRKRKMDEKSLIPKINFCCCDGEKEKRVLFDYIVVMLLEVSQIKTNPLNFPMNGIYCHNFSSFHYSCDNKAQQSFLTKVCQPFGC